MCHSSALRYDYCVAAAFRDFSSVAQLIKRFNDGQSYESNFIDLRNVLCDVPIKNVGRRA